MGRIHSDTGQSKEVTGLGRWSPRVLLCDVCFSELAGVKVLDVSWPKQNRDLFPQRHQTNVDVSRDYVSDEQSARHGGAVTCHFWPWPGPTSRVRQWSGADHNVVARTLLRHTQSSFPWRHNIMYDQFLPRNAMHSADHAVATSQHVCPSVRHTPVLCLND